MKKTVLALIALGSALPAMAAVNAVGFGSADVEAMIRSEPAHHVYNKTWFNYQSDILEARKEYHSDMGRATDREDRIDALVEFHDEVVDADRDYVKEMRERGYRVGRVSLILEG